MCVCVRVNVCVCAKGTVTHEKEPPLALVHTFELAGSFLFQGEAKKNSLLTQEADECISVCVCVWPSYSRGNSRR